MAAFEYNALNRDGRNRRGMIEADSLRHARAQLRERELTPLEVVAVSSSASSHSPLSTSPSAPRRVRLAAGEQALLLRQLSTLVEAGLPLEEALAVVGEQSEGKRSRRLMAAIRARILEGRSLGQALREAGSAFPPLVAASIEAGEQSGRLGLVLRRLADYTESRQNMGQKVWLALLYPLLVAVVAIVVLGALLAYVMPQVLEVFRDLDASLPALTRALLSISDGLQNYGVALLLAALAGLVGLFLAWQHPGLGRRMEIMLLALPLFGPLLRKADAARLSRTLGLLIGSGVPVVDALGSARAVVSTRCLRDVVDQARIRVREGGEMGQALARGKQFDTMVTRMISAGERAGNLDEMLERSADALEDDLRTRIATLVGLIEPLMIVVVAVMVLLIVLGIMTPILQFNELLTN